jgi:hypothetical protein
MELYMIDLSEFPGQNWLRRDDDDTIALFTSDEADEVMDLFGGIAVKV